MKQQSNPKIALNLLLTALLFSLLCPAVFAELTIIYPRIGFAGNYHAGAWTPVTLTLDNNEGDVDNFEGRIEVEVTGTEHRYLYSQEVILPKGSIKQYQLYAKFVQGGDPPRVTIYTKRGLKATEPAILRDNAMEPESPLIVIAKDRESGSNYPKRFGSRRDKVAIVPPEDLPEQWYGYQGVTLLVIPKLVRNGFNKQQEEAIVKWVESGGKLLVLGGKDSVTFNKSFIEKEFGLVFGKTHLMELPKFPKHLQPRAVMRPPPKVPAKKLVTDISNITTEKNARVLLKDGPLKLAVRQQRGQGYVESWGWNLDDRNINNAPLVKMLWDAQVSDHTPPYLPHVFGEFMYNKFKHPFKNDDGQNVPNILAILLILMIYFVAVAGNFRYLARIKKLELAWISLPVIIFGFSTGIYMIGLFTKSDSLTLRHYNIINCKLNQETGNLNSIVMLWSPTKRSYMLTPSSESGVTIDHQFWHSGELTVLDAIVDPLASVGGTVSQKPKTRFTQTADSMFINDKEMRHGVWSMLNLQDVFTLEGSFSGDLRWRISQDQRNNEVKGKLVNNTSHKFEDVFLVMNRTNKSGSPMLQAVRLDSWKPGDELEINPLEYTSEFKSAGSLRLDSLDLLRGSNKEDEREFRTDVAKALISSRFETLRLPRNSAVFREQANTAWLVGWSAELKGQVTLAPRPQKEDSYTLFCIDISPEHNGRYRYNRQSMRPLIVRNGKMELPDEFNEYSFGLDQAEELKISMKLPNQSAPLKTNDLVGHYRFKDLMTRSDYIRFIQELQKPENSGTKKHREAVVNFYEKMKVQDKGSLDMSIYNYCDQNYYNICKWVTSPKGASDQIKEFRFVIPAAEAAEFVNPFSGEIILRAKNKKTGWASQSEFYDIEIETDTIPTEVEL